MKPTEQELLKLAKAGDPRAMETLVSGYKPLVAGVARRYFLLGGETDDLVQEGMIGLYNAVQTYDENSAASFKTFANLCITRKVQTAVKNANRQKNKMLNFFLTINNQGIILYDAKESAEEETEESDLGIYIESKLPHPEDVIISRERIDYIKQQIENKLTLLEKNVLQLFVAGNTYAQIAKELNIDKKMVDNILFKVRKKLAFLKNE